VKVFSSRGLSISCLRTASYRAGTASSAASRASGHFLEKAEIVANLTESAEQALFAMVVSVMLVTVTAAAEIAFDIVHDDLAADNRCRATERAHRHAAAVALQKSSQATLLLSLRRLHGRSAGRWRDIRQAGVATGAGGCAQRGHRHADRAAQNHWLLIPSLRVRLLRRIAAVILRLSIRLLVLGWLLRVRLSRILRRLLGVRLLIWPRLWLSARRCSQSLATAIAEPGARMILRAATITVNLGRRYRR
jgi:hypothetical protein